MCTVMYLQWMCVQHSYPLPASSLTLFISEIAKGPKKVLLLCKSMDFNVYSRWWIILVMRYMYIIR